MARTTTGGTINARLTAPLRRVKRLRSKLRRGLLTEWVAHCRRQPIEPDTVLYEAFGGRGALCNPEAIFREALADPALARLSHVWAIDPAQMNSPSVRALADTEGVRVVERGSRAYWMALSTAGTLVNNATFLPQFSKRDGQRYLNTWHGTPLKHMGFDMPNGAVESANVTRNFLSADYLLSQNRFMTERMYLDGYRLRGILPGTVLELGYPRTDLQHDGELVAAVRGALDDAGFELDGRRVVLYAPTWRGATFGRPQNNAAELLDTVSRLQRRLGDTVRVLLKPHPSVAKFARELPEGHGVVIPDEMPTNVVLGLADVLITDFSSIFFDYLSLDRPIVFYAPDAEDYSVDRGMYWSAQELPGPLCADEEQTALALERALGEQRDDDELTLRRRRWQADLTAQDRGDSAKRIVQLLFHGAAAPVAEASASATAAPAEAGASASGTPAADAPRKQRLLLYPGGMRPNGITVSVLNLLARLDYERFDVTVISQKPRSAAEARTQSLVDPRARLLLRVGGMNGSKATQLVRRLTQRPGLIRHAQRMRSQQRLWQAEAERCFGDAEFDRAIDFSGYAQFWAQLMLAAPASKRAIWLHNDLAAEAKRPVNGRTPMRRSLGAVAELYTSFDSLVSVSPALSTINEAAFRRIAPRSRFTSARNVMAITAPSATAEQENGPWLSRMSEPDSFWFITVGRYSAEKNQERLIRAFARVHAERPETRLLLVGYGPLHAHLDEVIEELGLDDSVFLTGAVSTPLQLMEAADAFVLSSDWEGQPMVLLEAATVGLPIVSVAFGSVSSALPGDELHVVERTVPALADGLRAVLEGQVATARLDVAEYNRSALAEFAAAIDEDTSRG